VLIGCFGDPGLWALRETSNVPVSGLAEASFFQARQSGRFAIVTGGARWKPMLERLAGALGYADVLGRVHTVVPSGVELANHPEHALALLTHACEEAARDTSIRAIVLGGAGLAGMAALVQPRIQVPVIDSVFAGTRYVLDLPALSGTPHPKTVEWVHLSAEMCAWA
jgi:Asp/Glu/hydantoin racemase